MSVLPLDGETDPIRRAIIAATNRLLARHPTQLQRATERLTARDRGQRQMVAPHPPAHRPQGEVPSRGACANHTGSGPSVRRRLRRPEAENAELRQHSRHLESRLEIYATALNQLALENAALSGREADAAKVRMLPRRRQPNP